MQTSDEISMAIDNILKHQNMQLSLQNIASLSDKPGPSSSSRRYGHFITLNAVTPCDVGEGLEISYGFHQCEIGSVFIATTQHGICLVAFSNTWEKEKLIARLNKDWPNATIKADAAKTTDYASRLFEQQCSADKPIPLLVKGTNFQIQVWQALLNIPFAEVSSYYEIATAIGKPKALRAVGSAIGKNPIAFYIPCHRVLQKSGALGGYHWGLDKKYALLIKEAALKE